MIKKKCNICGKLKDINDFHKMESGKYGVKGTCKKCYLIKKKEYDKKNKLKYKRYYQDNKERIKAVNKKWRNRNKESIQKRVNKWHREKWNNNYNFRLNRNLKNKIYQCLNKRKNGQRWEDLVGYTLEDLKSHLEKQFKPGMNWENYGKWEIDHIIPLSWFNIKGVKSKGFKKAWALENLRPLWAEENKKKRNKILI